MSEVTASRQGADAMEDVCALADLVPREPRVVRVAGREVVLVRWDDEVFAVRNTCPHQGQSFACGNVRPRLHSSGPDQGLVADYEDPVLVCPWHTWGFELRNGTCMVDRSLRVRTYSVVVEDGRVLVGP